MYACVCSVCFDPVHLPFPPDPASLETFNPANLTLDLKLSMASTALNKSVGPEMCFFYPLLQLLCLPLFSSRCFFQAFRPLRPPRHHRC